MSYEIERRVCINGEVRPPLPGENTTFCAVYTRDSEGHAKWVADIDANTPEKALALLRAVAAGGVAA